MLIIISKITIRIYWSHEIKLEGNCCFYTISATAISVCRVVSTPGNVDWDISITFVNSASVVFSGMDQNTGNGCSRDIILIGMKGALI